MALLNRLFKEVPMDYQEGFKDGLIAGMKLYKDSMDKMYKAVLNPKIVRATIEKEENKRKEAER